MDYLVIGGAMANTFLVAQGFNMGKSLYEKDCIDIAKSIFWALNYKLKRNFRNIIFTNNY